MIIPALCDLYRRLEHAGDDNADALLAPHGYGVVKVSFVVVLNTDGTLHAFEDARRTEELNATSKRKPRVLPRSLVVPEIPGRTVAIAPGFLCDKTEYLLGLAPPPKPGGRAVDPRRVAECFAAFKQRHLSAEADINDAGFSAVCAFLKKWDPSTAAEHPLLSEVAGGNGVFQIRNRLEFVHESEAVRAYWADQLAVGSDAEGGDPSEDRAAADRATSAPSLVTGRSERLARLHEPAIKGVVGAQSSGAKLASFNCPSFESYGKSQTYNAPVGVEDASRYCKALNYLLVSDRHRVRLGETTVVFWTESQRALMLFGQVIAGHGGGQDEALLSALAMWGSGARRGLPSDLGDPGQPFYVLGLSPNISRLSVRFWIGSTVGGVFEHLAQHAAALTLDGAPNGFQLPTLTQIARETVMAKNGWPDEDRIAPRLIGELGRAVLLGLPYPASLLGSVVQRVRTDGWVNADKRTEGERTIGHRRASIIAACLRRAVTPKEVPMSLNEQHPAQAYHLGRLFALLDKVAEEGSGGSVNRRGKYFASASANPVTVFPRLLRLSNFDLNKFGGESGGLRVMRERQLQQICDHLREFPSFLPLPDQGLFCLGFYQQRQSFFTPKSGNEASASTLETITENVS
ncbi:MAG: type I-C CRISPR-associated protein Cas8c/Csd1 [Phycisphaeraceae bacterium]|nr:type I-C CRISPR-associated protein Cas8c/Csd1 [Phycisphaeraceae bacterium]